METDRKMPSRLCRTNGTRHSGPQQGFLDSECDKPPPSHSCRPANEFCTSNRGAGYSVLPTREMSPEL